MTPCDKAVVTLCTGPSTLRIAGITYPLLRAYAEKIGAAFEIISDPGNESTPHFAKSALRNLLDRYDRLLYVDTDILVSRDCPDLFQEVPEEALGVYFESEEFDRSLQIRQAQEALGDIGWEQGYFNSGVMVASRAHRDIFGTPFGIFVDPWFFEQTLLNYNARRLQTRFHPLSRKFNFLAAAEVGAGISLSPWRFGMHLIHYAGPPAIQNARFDLITRDARRLSQVRKIPGAGSVIRLAASLARTTETTASRLRRRALRNS